MKEEAGRLKILNAVLLLEIRAELLNQIHTLTEEKHTHSNIYTHV